MGFKVLNLETKLDLSNVDLAPFAKPDKDFKANTDPVLIFLILSVVGSFSISSGLVNTM